MKLLWFLVGLLKFFIDFIYILFNFLFEGYHESEIEFFLHFDFYSNI